MHFHHELSKFKVLVIDHITTMRSMTRGFLREVGIGVIDDTDNGLKALEIISVKTYDLIICDWDIPELNGLDLLKHVRANESSLNTLFFMITSSHDIDKVKQSIDAGVNEYIIKPYQPDYLINKVTHHLSKVTTPCSIANILNQKNK